jgi:hypothetical protein
VLAAELSMLRRRSRRLGVEIPTDGVSRNVPPTGGPVSLLLPRRHVECTPTLIPLPMHCGILPINTCIEWYASPTSGATILGTCSALEVRPPGPVRTNPSPLQGVASCQFDDQAGPELNRIKPIASPSRLGGCRRPPLDPLLQGSRSRPAARRTARQRARGGAPRWTSLARPGGTT